MTESEKLLFELSMEEWDKNGRVCFFDLLPEQVQKELIREGYMTLLHPHND